MSNDFEDRKLQRILGEAKEREEYFHLGNGRHQYEAEMNEWLDASAEIPDEELDAFFNKMEMQAAQEKANREERFKQEHELPLFPNRRSYLRYRGYED